MIRGYLLVIRAFQNAYVIVDKFIIVTRFIASICFWLNHELILWRNIFSQHIAGNSFRFNNVVIELIGSIHRHIAWLRLCRRNFVALRINIVHRIIALCVRLVHKLCRILFWIVIYHKGRVCMIGEILVITIPRLHRGSRAGAQFMQRFGTHVMNQTLKFRAVSRALCFCFCSFVLLNGATRVQEHLPNSTLYTLVFNPFGAHLQIVHNRRAKCKRQPVIVPVNIFCFYLPAVEHIARTFRRKWEFVLWNIFFVAHGAVIFRFVRVLPVLNENLRVCIWHIVAVHAYGNFVRNLRRHPVCIKR